MRRSKAFALLVVVLAGCGSSSSSTSGSGGASSSSSTSTTSSSASSTSASSSSTSTSTTSSSSSSSSGAGGAGGAAPTCKAAFCEDFEAAALDQATWTIDTNGGTFELQTTRVAHGKQAAHVHVDGNGRWAMLNVAKVPPAITTHLFGRAYFWWEDASNGMQGHAPFFTAGAEDYWKGDWTGAHYEVGNYQQSFQVGLQPGDVAIGAQGKVPVGAWSCVEWEMDASTNAINVWTDGASQVMWTPQGQASWVSAFKAVEVGFAKYSDTATGFDVWIDDVALDTQRIGCL